MNQLHCLKPLLLLLFFFSCNKLNKRIPIGNIEDTKKKFVHGSIYYESNNNKKGLQVIDSIFKQINSPTLYDYDCYFNAYANDAAWDKQYYKQIRYVDSLIVLIKKNSSEKEVGDIFINAYLRKSSGYYSLQNIELGNEYYFKAFIIAEKFELIDYKSQLSYDIAMKMYQQKKFDTAVKYFKLSYNYNQVNSEIPAPYKNNKTQELLDNIGLCYTNLQNIDSAIAYYSKCIQFLNNPQNILAKDSGNNKIRNRSALGVVHGNLAKVFVLQNKIETAIALYKKAIIYNDFVAGDINDMQTCMIQLANIFIKQNNKLALQKLIAQFINSLEKNNVLKTRMEAEKMQHHFYLLNKQPIKALEKLQLYTALKDSLAIQEVDTNKQDITKELKDREQQLQISLLKKSNEVSTLYNWAFGAFLIVAIVVSILVFTFYKKEKKNLEKQAKLNKEITKQKKEIEIVAYELTNSNKQKERLMDIMAHELRSPISGITAVANTLKYSTHLSKQDAELIDIIEQTSSNTLSLINQLLEEKNQAAITLKKGATNINNLVKQAITLLQHKANEKQQLIIFIEFAEQIEIKIDAEKIERVFINLLTNAIKFSHNKKNIWVSIEALANTIKLIIKDEGIGMSDGQLSQLFNSEATLKRSGTMGEKSFGLGLPICKQIVESHGGKLSASSTVQVGSTFIVELPIEI